MSSRKRRASSTRSSASGATPRTKRVDSPGYPEPPVLLERPDSLSGRSTRPEESKRRHSRDPMAARSLSALFRTRNRALAREIAALERALEMPSTVLIVGESGTGKDHLARALHEGSSRGARPFVRIDAANLSDELFESEMFGHERGAFTGAVAATMGLLEAAGSGTAYLNEVSSLSPAAQAKLLRVLQEKTFRRLGGTDSHAFDARLIVSSRRDLSALVEQGLFRPDLFYRIDVVSLRLPRLAERSEDILPLA